MQHEPSTWPMIAALAAVVYPGLGLVGFFLALYVKSIVGDLDRKITGYDGPVFNLEKRVSALEGETPTVREVRDWKRHQGHAT